MKFVVSIIFMHFSDFALSFIIMSLFFCVFSKVSYSQIGPRCVTVVVPGQSYFIPDHYFLVRFQRPLQQHY